MKIPTTTTTTTTTTTMTLAARATSAHNCAHNRVGDAFKGGIEDTSVQDDNATDSHRSDDADSSEDDYYYRPQQHFDMHAIPF